MSCGHQTEKETLMEARNIAPTAENIRALPRSACCRNPAGPGGVYGALRTANEFQRDPVIVGVDAVPQQRRCGVGIVDNDVDVAIIEQVSKCRAPAGNRNFRPPTHTPGRASAEQAA